MNSSTLYEKYLRDLPLVDRFVQGDGLLPMPDPSFTGSQLSFAFEEWERNSPWRQTLSEAGDLQEEKNHEAFLRAQGFSWIGMEHPFHQPCPDWPEPYHPVADLQALFQPNLPSNFKDALAGLQLGFTQEIRNLSVFLAAVSHRFAQYIHFEGRDFKVCSPKFRFDVVSEGEISRLFDKWLISRQKPDGDEMARFQSFLMIQVALLCHKSNCRLHIRTGMVQNPVTGYQWTLPEQPLKDMERFFLTLYKENCLPAIFWQPSGTDWTNALRLTSQFTDTAGNPLVQVLPDLSFPFSASDFHRWLHQLYAEGRLENSCLPGSSARNLAELERNSWMRKELCKWWAQHPFLSARPEEEVGKCLRQLAG